MQDRLLGLEEPLEDMYARLDAGHMLLICHVQSATRVATSLFVSDDKGKRDCSRLVPHRLPFSEILHVSQIKGQTTRAGYSRG